jgi:uncharacterized protein YdeI (YjbR/CyaY-like superfamily)
MAKTAEAKTLYVTNRDNWRAWLEKNHDTAKEIWLIYCKKHSGKPRIPYDDAVEEALCFGWIDSIIKRIDDEKYMQKYTPRRNRSVWSAHNKRRALKMIREGRMTEAGQAKIRQAKKDGTWQNPTSARGTPPIPPDLKKALAANKKARANFDRLAPSHQNRYIWWINSAKREATRQKRIEETVRLAAAGKMLGLK